MVKIMGNPIKMDDLGGKSTIFGSPHIYQLERIDGATPMCLGLSWPSIQIATFWELSHLFLPRCNGTTNNKDKNKNDNSNKNDDDNDNDSNIYNNSICNQQQ